MEFWDQMVECICRPPRDSYTLDQLLGSPAGRSFQVGPVKVKRSDFQLVNKHGARLQCSHYVPISTDRGRIKGREGRLPVVVYCHCNSGSRRDAEEAIGHLLPMGIGVVAFDFMGSGLSEGQWVTLGYNEADDLQVVVEWLRARRDVSDIGLWGRSMGAVTALLYSGRDPNIKGMVLDSPFSRLTDLMTEIVKDTGLPIPKPLVRMAASLVRRSVRRKAGFDINLVSPLDAVSGSVVPAVFGHATGDSFIRLSHSEKLVAAYGGEYKNLVRFEGDHNHLRPRFFYDSVTMFFHQQFKMDEQLPGHTEILMEYEVNRGRSTHAAGRAAFGAAAAAVALAGLAADETGGGRANGLVNRPWQIDHLPDEAFNALSEEDLDRILATVAAAEDASRHAANRAAGAAAGNNNSGSGSRHGGAVSTAAAAAAAGGAAVDPAQQLRSVLGGSGGNSSSRSRSVSRGEHLAAAAAPAAAAAAGARANGASAAAAGRLFEQGQDEGSLPLMPGLGPEEDEEEEDDDFEAQLQQAMLLSLQEAAAAQLATTTATPTPGAGSRDAEGPEAVAAAAEAASEVASEAAPRANGGGGWFGRGGPRPQSAAEVVSGAAAAAAPAAAGGVGGWRGLSLRRSPSPSTAGAPGSGREQQCTRAAGSGDDDSSGYAGAAAQSSFGGFAARARALFSSGGGGGGRVATDGSGSSGGSSRLRRGGAGGRGGPAAAAAAAESAPAAAATAPAPPLPPSAAALNGIHTTPVVPLRTGVAAGWGDESSRGLNTAPAFEEPQWQWRQAAPMTQEEEEELLRRALALSMPQPTPPAAPVPSAAAAAAGAGRSFPAAAAAAAPAAPSAPPLPKAAPGGLPLAPLAVFAEGPDGTPSASGGSGSPPQRPRPAPAPLAPPLPPQRQA